MTALMQPKPEPQPESATQAQESAEADAVFIVILSAAKDPLAETTQQADPSARASPQDDKTTLSTRPGR